MQLNFENVKGVMKISEDEILVFGSKKISGEVASNFILNYRKHLLAKHPDEPHERVINFYDTHENGVYSFDKEMKSISKLMTLKERKEKTFFCESNAAEFVAFMNMAEMFDKTVDDYFSFLNWLVLSENALEILGEKISFKDIQEIMNALQKGKEIFAKAMDKMG